jgi:hypothetical protein
MDLPQTVEVERASSFSGAIDAIEKRSLNNINAADPVDKLPAKTDLEPVEPVHRM